MSMELHVFSAQPLDSVAAWQRAIDAEGFALQLSAERPFQAVKGFLPAQSGGEATGFECYHDDPRDLAAGYHDVDFDHSWMCVLTFRWGSNLFGCLAACMATAAYAKATSGIVFDPDSSEILTSQQAIERARQMEQELVTIQAELDRIPAQRDPPDES